jgi:subtilisin family serine protease
MKVSSSAANSNDKVSLTFFLDSENKLVQLQSQFGSENVQYLPDIKLVNLKIDKEKKNEFDKYNIEYTILPDIDTESNSPKVSVNSPYVLFPNSIYSTFNWSYSRIAEPLKGASGNGGDGVKIAVIDSGIDLTHPGLQDNNVTQINYSNGSNNEDEYGHGTQVAGVIDTLAPKASLYSYKVMDGTEGDSYNIIKAIVDASNKNVNIINISLGTEKNSNTSEILTIKAFEAAVEFAKSKGIFVVGSAGNESENLDEQGDRVHLPGGLDDVITVGATIKNGLKADYSNYGSKVDISGPVGWFGESYTTKGIIDAREMMVTYYPTTKISMFETPGVIPRGATLSFGTSLAAPEVSSALATLISKEKNRDVSHNYYDRIEHKLLSNSRKIDRNEKIGVGEVRIKD